MDILERLLSQPTAGGHSIFDRVLFHGAFVRFILALCSALVVARADASAQHSAAEHAGNPGRDAMTGSVPTLPGQDAYGAIAEIVALLEADTTTDWSRVELEGLRQHLIDMSEVTLHATVVQRPVPGGLQMDASGSGRTAAAIRRMVGAHAAELASSPLYSASAMDVPGGARLTVTAREQSDARLVQRIRGLGFIGLLASENHHAMHHLAIARGGHS
jgi:hypothetical protein